MSRATCGGAHARPAPAPARLLYPYDTEEDAVAAFVGGLFARPHAVTDHDTGDRIMPAALARRNAMQVIEEHCAAALERLGVPEKTVARLDMHRLIRQAESRPDGAFDTELMCPGCGRRGEYRRAANPRPPVAGGSKLDERWCRWRVGYPGCGLRTKDSYKTRGEAATAFIRGDGVEIPKRRWKN